MCYILDVIYIFNISQAANLGGNLGVHVGLLYDAVGPRPVIAIGGAMGGYGIISEKHPFSSIPRTVVIKYNVCVFMCIPLCCNYTYYHHYHQAV